MTEQVQSHSPSRNLAQWLSYLENLHITEIDLGLARIGAVANKLNIDLSASRVITVAGTNGKGTTCAFIENTLLAEGLSVAVYSSPHIECFNERLRINGQDISDQPLIAAFEQIELARADISLTYYEYTTLAAFIILAQQAPDVILLEVGLGGRLDATNLIDADIAVITSIDLDHQSFLGNSRAEIGFEKAGIFRKQQFAVVGDPNPPATVKAHAQSLATCCQYRGEHFDIVNEGNTWQWQYQDVNLQGLHQPHIPQDNVATALTVLAELARQLNIELTTAKVNQLIDNTKVAGRTELFKQQCDVMLDVGHNPHAARYLAKVVEARHYPKVYAVFAMLADKDIAEVLTPFAAVINHWFIAELTVPRAASNEQMTSFMQAKSLSFDRFDNIRLAFKMAIKQAQPQDLVLVFGSFFTVAEVRRLLL